ncbi:MAG: PhoD-like phosphatase N-terminal domain-containing protein, partial [Halobacteria archaeon]|nr:PhoD-like phosphatase N-terminal domain-containing protein [Halobacteria archaeon]
SGGSTQTGVILWTRVSPDAHKPDEPLVVEVANDEAFDDVVERGTVAPERIDEAHDYTVKVDLDGSLDSNTRYYYRFVYDGVVSQTGRCRTLPAPDDNIQNVSFAVVTCQEYQDGYYGAFHHVAQEDVD